MNTETPFTDHSAVVRGLQIAQAKAPLFSEHIQKIKADMERVAGESAKLGFISTAKAIRDFAHEL